MTPDDATFYARWLLHSTSESRATQSFIQRMLADLTGIESNKINTETQRCLRMGIVQSVETLASALYLGAMSREDAA